MHELIPRSLTIHSDTARELSFEKELCAMLCKGCHGKAHDSKEERDKLFQKNYRRYGYPAVAARYEQIVQYVKLYFQLPEEENELQ